MRTPGSLTLLGMAEMVLAKAKRSLTVEEIWKQGEKAGLVRQLRSRGKTPMVSLGALLYVSVRDDPSSRFDKDGVRPARFYLRSQAGSLQRTAEGSTQPATEKHAFAERDLHPLLAYFASKQLGVHSKTIFHVKSRKEGFAKWLYPDMVGVRLIGRDWQKDVVQFGRQTGQTMAWLFSFELKVRLDAGNLREAFFQAVSNSSWANEGYLVTAAVDENLEFRSELRRLSEGFGIGAIRLDTEDPGDSSEILFAARERSDLDWETVNRLAELNPDFREFIQACSGAVMVNKANSAEFDPVEEDVGKLVAPLGKKP